jgi:hypothetical protein
VRDHSREHQFEDREREIDRSIGVAEVAVLVEVTIVLANMQSNAQAVI